MGGVHLPIALRALLVAALSIAAALAVRAVLRRFLRPETVDAAQATAGPVMEATAGLFGVLAAFILAGAWQRFDETRSSMLVEYNAYTNLRQIARILPPPIHAEFGDSIEAYRQVALEELRRPAGGRPDSGADEIIERLWLILARFEPTTAGQAELQTRAFDAVEELGDARRALQLAVRRTPPPIIWVILAGGAAAVITLAAISSVGGRLPAVYLAVLTAVVALALYAIYALAYPVRTGLLADPSRHSESLLTRPSAASAAGEHSRSAPTLR